MRMPCYVESSLAGYPLFRRNDFGDVTDIVLNLSKYGKSKDPYRYKHVIMTRPPSTPPNVPPKDLSVRQTGNFDFGFLDRSASNTGRSAKRISGKASLIEIKRSPRPDRSSSSKESDGIRSPQPVHSIPSQELRGIISPGSDEHVSVRGSIVTPADDQSNSSRGSDSVSSTRLDRSDNPRQSDSVSSFTGRFSDPPPMPVSQAKESIVPRPWFPEFPEPPSKPASRTHTPPTERVWFSEHHSQDYVALKQQ